MYISIKHEKSALHIGYTAAQLIELIEFYRE